MQGGSISDRIREQMLEFSPAIYRVYSVSLGEVRHHEVPPHALDDLISIIHLGRSIGGRCRASYD